MSVELVLLVELLIIALIAVVVDVVRGALVARRRRRPVIVLTLPVCSLMRPGRNAPAPRSPSAPGCVAAQRNRGPPR